MDADTGNRGRARSQARPNLVVRVADDLRQLVLSKAIGIGEKLPSEAALTEKYQVSRTVVREAVAALRADGLVEARQGAGVFVISNQAQSANPFQGIDPEKLSSIIEILELRCAVEMEAAALAAVRCSPAQEEAIFERLGEIDRAIAEGASTTIADLAFHLAIADAANNPRFREFLEVLGGDAIPRGRLQENARETVAPDYLAQLQEEHRRIANAISMRDEAAARAAMRVHLQGGQNRYRRLLRQA